MNIRKMIGIILLVIMMILAIYPELCKANEIKYNLHEPSDLSYSYNGSNIKRLSFDLVIKEEVNSEELKELTKKIVEKVKTEFYFNAMNINIYDYKEYIGGAYTLGKVVFAPHGEWSKANSVRTGEYEKMSFAWDIKEKNWDKKLSPKEAEIWGYFDDLL